MKIKVFFLILLIFLFPIAAWGANCGVSAATYYVDFDTGLDSNNGTSTSTSWKTAPGGTGSSSRPVPNCTLQPGDKVIFKGGVTYADVISVGTPYGHMVINITASGSSGLPIVYDGDSGTYASRWGSGSDKAIIDGQSAAYANFYFGSAQSYITINNFVIKDGYYSSNAGRVGDCTAAGVPHPCCTGYQTGPNCNDFGGQLIYNNSASNNVTITNNDLSHGGTWDRSYGSGNCISNFGGASWTVAYNTLTDCGTNGAYMPNGGGHIVHHNTWEGKNTWALGFANTTSLSDLTNFQVYNNTFKNINKGVDCNIADKHPNWIYFFTYPPSEKGFTNVKIYNNLFYNDYSGFGNLCSSNSALQFVPENYNSTSGPVYFFNNVIFNGESSPVNFSVHTGGTPAFSGGLTNIYVMNNTIVNLAGYNPLTISGGYYGASQINNVFVKNNITYATGVWNLMVPIANSQNISGHEYVDYNFHYNPANADNLGVMQQVPSFAVGGYTMSQWITLQWGSDGYWDINSPNHTVYSNSISVDPKFINITRTPSFNLHLQSDSPLVERGANLTTLCTSLSLPTLCMDKDGVARSPSAAWDIGAYKYGPGSTPSSVQGVTITGGTIR